MPTPSLPESTRREASPSSVDPEAANSLNDRLARESSREPTDVAEQRDSPDPYATLSPESCPELPPKCEEPNRRDKVLPTMGGGVKEENGGFSTVIPVESDDRASWVASAALDDAAPVTVPGYEILGELGRGGMGVVYKARQIGLNRIVALKMILHAQHANKRERNRFIQEAEAVARLQHPNIVGVYETGEHAGTPYFSLEFCSGGSLNHKLASAALEPRAAAELLETLARAVHAAHQANVIHRDLKPANILLTAGGQPKITDFGLAKRIDEVGQTRHGEIMGTPSYMAPEQATGAVADICPATDVYSLGAILYELLTGHPPFKGASTWDTLAMVCDREPVPPSRVQNGLPRDLETICMKALNKQRDRRYPSALEMADDLRSFLSGEPIKARRTPAWERALKWAKRRPTAAALVVALVLATMSVVAGGVSYGLYKDQQATTYLRRLEGANKVANLFDEGKEAAAAGQLALAQGRNDDAAASFSRAAKCLGDALTTIDADRDAYEPTLRTQIEQRGELVRQLQDEYDARQRIQQRVGEFHKDYQQLLFLEIGATERDQASNREQLLRLAPAALARFGVKSGRPEETAAALTAEQPRFASPKQCTEVAEKCYEILLVWAEAEAAGRPGDTRAPAERARAALALLESAEALGTTQHLDTPQAFFLRRERYNSMAGDVAGAAADRDRAGKMKLRGALDFFLAGLASWRKGDVKAASLACAAAIQQQSDHFWAQYLQALCQLRLGNWADASAGFRVCLVLQPEFLWARLQRASALVELNELTRADADFDKVLKESTDPLQRYVALVNRTPLRMKQKRAAAALDDLAEAIKLFPNDPRAYVNRAQIYGARRDWARVIGELSWAIKVSRPRVDSLLHFSRAFAYLERNDRRSAQADLEIVVAQGPEGGSEERYLTALVMLGHQKHLNGNYAAALADFDTALRRRPDYPFAHLQRAKTLLKLDEYARAGAALDRYEQKGKPTFEVYLARGMIHARLGQHPRAIESYNLALQLKQDPSTHAHRGWSYLRVDSPRLALADFEFALEKGEPTFDALCGRATARVRLGQVKEAVEEAGEAQTRAVDAEELFLIACVYARAGAVTLVRSPRSPVGSGYEKQAVALLNKALAKVPEGKRPAFWRKWIQKEEALASVRNRDPRLRRMDRDWSEK